MQQRSAIVVIVDRLGAGFLGPYGNTWLETPEFNRLASQSFLCEQAISDSPRLDVVYRSYWRGLHAMCPEGSTNTSALPALAASRNIAATLLTDEPSVAQHALAGGFADQIVLAPSEVAAAASEPGQTQLARLFATAADWVTRARPPFLLWIHAQGMAGPWDAPAEFRRQFADDDDPPPPEFVAPPARRLTAGFDPDEAWGLVQAYAGQVALLDMSLGVLLDAIADSPAAGEALFMLSSPRGFPLGEHLRVGAEQEALYGELLQAPWLVRLPNGAGALLRTQALVQPADLFASLADWLGLPTDSAAVWGRSLLSLVAGESGSLRDRACAVLEGERAIRTPAWFLREEGQRCELFVKPDDRWEVNEVSSRCQRVVEELASSLDQFEQAAQSLPFVDPPPLSRVLAEGLD